MPFRRDHAPAPDHDASPADSSSTSTSTRSDESKKGRPTPSRKDREEANRRPIVVADRRAASRAARAKAKSERQAQYQAMRTNDTANLPARDRGPVREYIRDYVDARWNVGELFLFAAFALLVLSMVFVSENGSASLLGAIFLYSIYGIVILAVVDAILLWRSLKRRITEKFGADKIEKGMLMYTLARAFQIRRARMPKPKSKRHGRYPD